MTSQKKLCPKTDIFQHLYKFKCFDWSSSTTQSDKISKGQKGKINCNITRQRIIKWFKISC